MRGLHHNQLFLLDYDRLCKTPGHEGAVLIQDGHRAGVLTRIPLSEPFNVRSSDLFLEFNDAAARIYPQAPPTRVFVTSKLRFEGRRLKDHHRNTSLAELGFAWLCFSRIDWDPNKDDLVTMIDVVWLRLHALTPDDLED
jgi:hypothetical protein